MRWRAVTWIKIYDENLEKDYERNREAFQRNLRKPGESFTKKAL
jgi:hypothetical protein